MKILLADVYSNWDYWTHEELIKYDLYIYLEGQRYEVSGMHRNKETISYVKDDRIITVPITNILYLIVEGYDDADIKK